MHGGDRFNPKKLKSLNDPRRLEDIPPSVIWKRLGLSDAGTFIDIGAGTGLFTKAFLDLSGAARAYACDVEPLMIAWLKKNAGEYADRLIPVEAAAEDVPLDSETADFVLMINLHHELDDVPLALKESLRLLKPGGMIAVVDWKKKFTLHGPPLSIRIDGATIAAQLTAAGFESSELYNGMADHSLVTGRKPSI